MLADINSDGPLVRSRDTDQLTILTPLMQQLAFTKDVAGACYAARNFRTLEQPVRS